MRRFHEAKLQGDAEVIVWGSGTPMREFLHVDDMAQASCYVMNLDKSVYTEHTEPMLSHINVGSGQDLTIAELARLIGEVVGYQGQIEFDLEKPDGVPRKLLNSRRLQNLGWRAAISLEEGLVSTYQDFLKNHS